MEIPLTHLQPQIQFFYEVAKYSETPPGEVIR